MQITYQKQTDWNEYLFTSSCRPTCIKQLNCKNKNEQPFFWVYHILQNLHDSYKDCYLICHSKLKFTEILYKCIIQYKVMKMGVRQRVYTFKQAKNFIFVRCHHTKEGFTYKALHSSFKSTVAVFIKGKQLFGV